MQRICKSDFTLLLRVAIRSQPKQQGLRYHRDPAGGNQTAGFKGVVMKRLLFASLGAVALMSTGPAFAADVAVPIYKAPPIVYSSWTGVYAGVEAGYKWSDMTWNTTCLGFS